MGYLDKLCVNCNESKFATYTQAKPNSGVIVTSPVKGDVTTVKENLVKIKNTADDCDFYVIIEGEFEITVTEKQILNKGDTIGTGKGNMITLKVPASFGSETLNDYYEGTVSKCKKKEKTKKDDDDDKSSKKGKGTKPDPGLERIKDLVAGRSAWPIFGAPRGLPFPGWVTEGLDKENLVEEIERIKELLK